MTDINPAGAAGTSGVEVLAGDDGSMDENMRMFYDHSFEDPDAIQDESGGDTPAEEGKAAEPAPAAAPAAIPDPASPAPAAPAPANAQPSAAEPAPGAAPLAPESAAPAVDPADLAAMMGLGQAPAAPAAAPAPAPSPASSPAPSGDEPFLPFQPNFRLPEKLAAALFDAEDRETRHEALITVLSNYGNAIVQTIEGRLKEHHVPRIHSEMASSMSQAQAAASVMQDFYGEYPELLPYREVVKKAATVIGQRNPTAGYSAELRESISALAQQALIKGGVLAAPIVAKSKRTAAAAPATPPAAAPSRSPKPGKVFEAGSARPGGFQQQSDSDSPAALVEQLSQF